MIDLFCNGLEKLIRFPSPLHHAFDDFISRAGLLNLTEQPIGLVIRFGMNPRLIRILPLR